jgi:hypothetical protein
MERLSKLKTAETYPARTLTLKQISCDSMNRHGGRKRYWKDWDYKRSGIVFKGLEGDSAALIGYMRRMSVGFIAHALTRCVCSAHVRMSKGLTKTG